MNAMNREQALLRLSEIFPLVSGQPLNEVITILNLVVHIILEDEKKPAEAGAAWFEPLLKSQSAEV